MYYPRPPLFRIMKTAVFQAVNQYAIALFLAVYRPLFTEDDRTGDEVAQVLKKNPPQHTHTLSPTGTGRQS